MVVVIGSVVLLEARRFVFSVVVVGVDCPMVLEEPGLVLLMVELAEDCPTEIGELHPTAEKNTIMKILSRIEAIFRVHLYFRVPSLFKLIVSPDFVISSYNINTDINKAQYW